MKKALKFSTVCPFCEDREGCLPSPETGHQERLEKVLKDPARSRSL